MSGNYHDDDEVDEDEIVEKFIRTFSNGDYDVEFRRRTLFRSN
jgi:hypothetical protein